MSWIRFDRLEIQRDLSIYLTIINLFVSSFYVFIWLAVSPLFFFNCLVAENMREMKEGLNVISSIETIGVALVELRFINCSL